MIIDFVTGKKIPDVGAEANRQEVEKFLVQKKGYLKTDIEIDVDMEIIVAGNPYRTQIDMVVSVGDTRFMVIKCAAGSLGSREREIVAAARILEGYQLPISVVSDGKTAIVLDTISGKKIGESLTAIPSKEKAGLSLKAAKLQPLPEGRFEREKLIFRSYDEMNVNVRRNILGTGTK